MIARESRVESMHPVPGIAGVGAWGERERLYKEQYNVGRGWLHFECFILCACAHVDDLNVPLPQVPLDSSCRHWRDGMRKWIYLTFSAQTDTQLHTRKWCARVLNAYRVGVLVCFEFYWCMLRRHAKAKSNIMSWCKCLNKI